jgi:hypothetical protein
MIGASRSLLADEAAANPTNPTSEEARSGLEFVLEALELHSWPTRDAHAGETARAWASTMSTWQRRIRADTTCGRGLRKSRRQPALRA